MGHANGSPTVSVAIDHYHIVVAVLKDDSVRWYAAQTFSLALRHNVSGGEHPRLQQATWIAERYPHLHRTAVGVEHIVDLIHPSEKFLALVGNRRYDNGVSCVDLTDITLVDVCDDPYSPQVGNLKGGLVVRVFAHITVVEDVCRCDISRDWGPEQGVGSTSQSFDMSQRGSLLRLGLCKECILCGAVAHRTPLHR